MKKMLNILSKIRLILLNLLVFWIVFRIFKGLVLIVIGVIILLSLSFYLLMTGKKKILKERKMVDAYAAAKLPITFSKKNIVIGYIMMFSILWVIMPFLFLLPSSVAIAYTLPPIAITYILLRIKWFDMWKEFGLKRKEYFALHFFGLLIPSVIVAIIKLLT